MNNFLNYNGWELNFFDEAKNFRNYQHDILKNYLYGSVAEVGPGSGSLCERYKDYCESIILYEPTKKLFENLLQKFNDEKKIEVKNNEFVLKKNKFDCILIMDVIEHIENPKSLIEKLFVSLNPNGKLLINVPAFQHLYSLFDKDVGHIKRYNKNSFLKELNFVKAKKINMFYYDSVGYILSLLSQILFKISKDYQNNYKKNFSKKIYIWNFLMPTSRIIDKCFFNSFGKSLFIVVEK